MASSLPIIVLFHGLKATPRELSSLISAFSKEGYEVYAPILKGYTDADNFDFTISYLEWLEEAQSFLNNLLEQNRPIIIGGLCIGANIALYLASKYPENIKGCLLLSSTLFYDGWNLLWYHPIFPLLAPTPLRYFYTLRERSPYGIKNERMRRFISKQMTETGHSIAGARDLPATLIYEAYRLIQALKRKLCGIHQPALILHSTQDDMSSLRSPFYLKTHLGSTIIELHLLENSYHMLTLDNDRFRVAQYCIAFSEKISL